MQLLACVDGSQWANQALWHLARRMGPADRLVLLYVAPRAGEGYLECGRLLLEAALHQAGLSPEDPRIQCRMESGDPAERILKVCREQRPAVVAMGSRGADGFPYLSELGAVVRTVWLDSGLPVLLASPRGTELLVADERILTLPRVPDYLPAAAIQHGK